MKSPRMLWIALVLAGITVAFGAYVYLDRNDAKKNWERCAATHPVMESNPPQCIDDRGHHWGPPTYGL